MAAFLTAILAVEPLAVAANETTQISDKMIDVSVVDESEYSASEHGVDEIPSETPDYIVVTENKATANEVKEVCDDAVLEDERLEKNQVILLEENSITEEELKQLSDVEGVVAVEENYIMEAAENINTVQFLENTTNTSTDIREFMDLSFLEEKEIPKEQYCDKDYEWNLQMINTPECTSDLAKVKVAILDSGERVIIMSS